MHVVGILDASWTDMGVSWGLLEAPRSPERKDMFLLFFDIGATEDCATEGATRHAPSIANSSKNGQPQNPRSARPYSRSHEDNRQEALQSKLFGSLCVARSYYCQSKSVNAQQQHVKKQNQTASHYQGQRSQTPFAPPTSLGPRAIPWS